MQVAVWDTYAKRDDGSLLHFDILVPHSITDSGVIFGYGSEYLRSRGETATPTAEYCQYCHVETLQPEWENAIREKGYFILEMEDIPARLPESPTRRQKILYLRGHFSAFRFANFAGKNDAEIDALIQEHTS